MSAPTYPRPPIVEALGDGSAIVEAAAGTGKTWTIEQLVVDQLLRHGLPIDRVLVVTFTRKATGELTNRVRSQLRKLLGSPALSAPEREKLLVALRHFDQAPISTIHAFCQRVLAEHSVLANHLPPCLPPPLDLPRQAFRNCLRTTFLQEPVTRQLVETLVSAGWEMSDLEDLLVACLKARATLVPRASVEGVTAAWQRLVKLLDATGEALAQSVLGDKGLAKALGTLLASYRDVPLDNPWAQSLYFEDWAASEKDLQPAADAANQVDKHTPLASGRASTVKRVPALIPHYQALGECFAALQQSCPSGSAIISTVLVPVVEQELTRLRRESGHFDHDGLLSATRDALSGPHAEALIAALRKRYAVALVDEFQDTDEVQWELLKKVFLDPANQHRLIAVGDPKQAIYGFRGGDVLTYFGAARDIAAHGKKQPLDDNYRSTPAYVAAVNALFETPPDSPSFFALPEVQYRPVTAKDTRLALSGIEVSAPFQLVCLPAGDRPAGEHRAMQLEVISSTLSRLLEAGKKGATWSKSDGAGTETHPLSASDMLCLTFTNREASALAAHLRSRGIATALYREEGLLAGPEAQDLLDVLAALAEPSEPGLRRRAWLTPFFDARFAELAASDALPAEHPLNLRLADWAKKAAARDWDALFHAMLQGSGLNRRTLFVPGGEREYTNYQSLFELLQAQLRAGHDSLADLHRALSTWYSEPASRPEDGNVHRLPTDAAAVRVLTIHKAKGLQAPFVFLFGGTGNPPTGDVQLFHREGQRFGWLGEPDAETKGLIEKTATAEQLRTLYVAMTRARFATWIPFYGEVTGRADLYVTDIDGPLRHLVSTLADRISHATDFMKHCDVVVAKPSAATSTSEPPTWSPPPSAETTEKRPDFAGLREDRKGLVMKSYSSLSGKVDPGAQPAQRPQLPPVDKTKVPRGKNPGTYVHSLLEQLPTPRVAKGQSFEAWLGTPHLADHWERIAAHTSLTAPQLEDAQRMVFRGYATPLTLPSFGVEVDGLGHLDSFQSEVEFRFPLPETAHPKLGVGQVPPRWKAERGHMKGFLDFVFTDADQRLYFGDWKTNTLLDYAPATVAADVEANYREQIHIYTLALCRAADIRTRDDYERRFGGYVYVYLRDFRADGHGLCTGRVAWEALQDFEKKLWAYKLQEDDPEAATSAGESESSEENEREEES